MLKKVFFIVGPTAVGKTKFAIEFAKFLKTEIISADSRQIFKELKIGTAPPSEKELTEVKHYFIANKSIFDNYNASLFEVEGINLIENLLKKYNNLIVVGGSGLYIDALINGIDDLPDVEPEIRNQLIMKYEIEGIESLRFELKMLDPVSYNNIDLQNPKRILKALEITIQTGKPYSSFLTGKSKNRNFEPILIGLKMDKELLHKKITVRTNQMIIDGLLKEAKDLQNQKHLTALKTVGYREFFDFFDGKINFPTALEQLKQNTKKYAKRQMTWFNRYKNITWIDITNGYNIKNIIESLNN